MGDPQLFRALWGLWQFRTNRAELDAAGALGERLVALARDTDDTGVVIQAHHALWCHLFFQGELLASRHHVAQALALYDSDLHASLASVYGHHDPAVCAHSMGAWTFELLGDSERATQHSRDALALARQPYLLGALADAHATTGRVVAALDTIGEALCAVDKTGERFYESELLLLQGDLYLTVRRNSAEAEQSFRRALETAGRQGARLLELRALTSLRKLLDQQGRREEARQLDATVEGGPAGG